MLCSYGIRHAGSYGDGEGGNRQEGYFLVALEGSGGNFSFGLRPQHSDEDEVRIFIILCKDKDLF